MPTTVVLLNVTAFLEPFPATADTAAISHAARNHAPFANLTAADRRLTLALLSYSDSLRVYTNGHGERETIGPHRICWACTAGVAALPVWATPVRCTRHAPPYFSSLAEPSRGRPIGSSSLGIATTPATSTYRPLPPHQPTSLREGQTHHSVGWSPSSAACTAVASPYLTVGRDDMFPAELADLVQPAPQVTVEQLDRLLADDAVILVDIRNPGEVELGSIPGAIQVPLAQLRTRLDLVPTDRLIVVHCAGGWRSSVAASLMRAQGVDNVSDLAGGYNAWVEAHAVA